MEVAISGSDLIQTLLVLLPLAGLGYGIWKVASSSKAPMEILLPFAAKSMFIVMFLQIFSEAVTIALSLQGTVITNLVRVAPLSLIELALSLALAYISERVFKDGVQAKDFLLIIPTLLLLFFACRGIDVIWREASGMMVIKPYVSPFIGMHPDEYRQLSWWEQRDISLASMIGLSIEYTASSFGRGSLLTIANIYSTIPLAIIEVVLMAVYSVQQRSTPTLPAASGTGFTQTAAGVRVINEYAAIIDNHYADVFRTFKAGLSNSGGVWTDRASGRVIRFSEINWKDFTNAASINAMAGVLATAGGTVTHDTKQKLREAILEGIKKHFGV